MKEPTSIVYNMDCMEAMRDMQDNAFDLAVVDPPYGISSDSLHAGRSSKRNRMYGAGKLRHRILNTSKTDWDVAPTSEYFEHLLRVSRHAIIWGGNYFGLPRCRCFICWDKVQPWPNFSQCEYAWTTFDQPAKLFRFDNRAGGKIHPTQKPVELYDWIIEHFANPGMKIIDTHVGSGSSRIAAYKAKCDFVGYEIDKAFFEAQERRFRNALDGVAEAGENQLKLF